MIETRNLVSSEDREQYVLLTSHALEPGTARSRYAAAMYFYNRGLINDEQLEVFRILSKRDAELPTSALAAIGIRPVD
jgi:hypothetical protein